MRSARISTLLRSPRTIPPLRRFIQTPSAPPSGSSRSAPGFSTINSAEIEHFSSLSSQWWDPTGEFKLLHRMNPARVEYIRAKVARSWDSDEPEWTFETRHQDTQRESSRGTGRWLEGKRCLDVGCGGGLLSESLARLGGDVIGIDASASNIAIATLHASHDPFLPLVNRSTDDTPSAPTTSSSSIWSSFSSASSPAPTASASRSTTRGSLEYRATPAEALHRAGEKFDVVCAMEILEHVDNPGEFLKCLGDMVKPGGHLIMSTISRTPLSQLLTLTLAEDVLRLVTPGTHTYKKFVKPEELRRFVYAEMGGFEKWERNTDGSDVRRGEVGETRGIVYDPLKGDWRLWEGAEGTWRKGMGELCNYMFHARKNL